VHEGTYANGQIKAETVDGVMTHLFIDGNVKAQGPVVDGQMEGRWIFNKKDGLPLAGWPLENGVQHGSWTVFNADRSVQSEKHFDHGKVVKRS
jgi:antitoxin component YwqK of YwqJK toxin-antitoxin module